MITKFKIFESLSQDIELPNGVSLSVDQKWRLSNMIKSYLVCVYNYLSYKDQIIPKDHLGNVISRKVKSDNISKMPNNRNILTRIILDNSINSGSQLIDFIEENLYSLFHHKGKFFSKIYGVVDSSSERGRKNEIHAFKYFKELVKSKGHKIWIEPASMEKDREGIDGTFYLNNREYTIQVKTYSSVEEYGEDPSKFIALCKGGLGEIETDYFLITNGVDVYAFKGKGVELIGSYGYLIPKSNLLKP